MKLLGYYSGGVGSRGSKLLAVLMSVFMLSNIVAAQNQDEKLLAQVLAYHNKHADCDYKNEELTSDDMMVLDKSTTVAMVLCLTGAYQGSAVFYMVDTSDAEASVWTLNFATTQDGKMFGATDSLTSPEFNPATKTISSFYKSRGIGDCGATAVYKWSASGFYLVEASYMPCCSQPGEAEENAQCKVFLEKQRESDEEYPTVYRYNKN